ncbi:MAG TPA: ABC transporter permease [Opitutaceae bacterium]|jgi:ABC-2 type transport system permease protein
MRGFAYHLLLALRLNFKSRQALIYGYLVPVFFLIAFGAIFRTGRPPLLHQMSQLITISILGGACFGLPTALVAERERGLWRRFKLLPGALTPLLSSTLLARALLVGSAAVLQILLAQLLYGTPLPQHPWLFAQGFAAAAFAFLGLGLVVAALADDVPAVQALGQCLFLPLILIGGVGVPLISLPAWAQRLASFFPGRYAVDALQAGYSGDGSPETFRFNLAALAGFGLAAGFVGFWRFRWDPASGPAVRGRAVLAAAVLPWLAFGTYSVAKDNWHPLPPRTSALAIANAQIDSIGYDRLPPDDGVYTPLAPADFARELKPEARLRLDAILLKLSTWPATTGPDSAQSIRAYLNVAAIADAAEDRLEGPLARSILNSLYARYRRGDLVRGLAWVALEPDEGEVQTSVAEVGVPGEIDAREIRHRSAIYAAKFLGRLRGKIAN